MVYDKANELARELAQSEEYQTYKTTRTDAMESETTRTLIGELHQLQLRAQAMMVSGQKDEEALERMQKISEILQFNAQASAYLMAEFRLHRMLGDVYKILADAIDLDTSMLSDE